MKQEENSKPEISVIDRFHSFFKTASQYSGDWSGRSSASCFWSLRLKQATALYLYRVAVLYLLQGSALYPPGLLLCIFSELLLYIFPELLICVFPELLYIFTILPLISSQSLFFPLSGCFVSSWAAVCYIPRRLLYILSRLLLYIFLKKPVPRKLQVPKVPWF